MASDPATKPAPRIATPARGPGLHDRAFFGHPRGLRTLFFTEMWERFSYYGMRAILMLFMTAAVVDGGLGFGADKAGPIYAMYTSLVYLATVPGGWLADTYLGQRRSVLYGGVVIMLGHILLAFHGLPNFYSGLACIVIGTGLLKPNISVIVGQLYSTEDERRDAGFSIFYMGINIGAFTAPLVCGWLAQHAVFKAFLAARGLDPTSSWHWGFAAAAVGMFLGLVQYLLTGRDLGEAGLHPTKPPTPAIAARNRRTLGIGLTAAVLAIVALLAIDSRARYIQDVTFDSSAGGLVASGTLRESAEETLAIRGGRAFPPGEADRWLGEEAAGALRAGVLASEVAAGRAEGNLGKSSFLRIRDPEVTADLLQGKGLDPAAPPADLSGYPGLEEALQAVPEVRLTEISFRSEEGALSISARTLGDQPRSLHLGRIRASDAAVAFPEEWKPLRDPISRAVLEAAVAGGRARGTLQDQVVKIGGLNTHNIKGGFTILLLATVILFFSKLFLAGEWTRAERARLVTIFVLFCGAAVFWGIFEQAGSTLTLFADRSTDNRFLGMGFPSSWWQSLNALMIISLAPVFAWLWIRLGKRDPSYPMKFGFGLLFAGLGFAVLVGGAIPAQRGALVSPMWLFMVYLLHTIGELCLSPVGLSSMTKLAPARVVSLMMGVWFLAASVGNFMAGSVAGYYEKFELPALCGLVAAAGGVMALVMFLLVGPIKRMMARSEEGPVAAGH